MTEARLFTNVRTAWFSRGVGRKGNRPIWIEIDALWAESEYEVIGFLAKNGVVDTFRPVFKLDFEIGCDPLDHEFTLSEPPKPQLARADLVFKDDTRIGLQVRDRQRPVDVLDTLTGEFSRNQLWEMMSAKVAEYPVDLR
jgi:hypothetical protein